MMQFVQGDEKQVRVCEKDYDCKLVISVKKSCLIYSSHGLGYTFFVNCI